MPDEIYHSYQLKFSLTTKHYLTAETHLKKKYDTCYNQ